MLDVGEKAPEFELPDHRGETVRLSDYRGERVVVYFYPRANTPGCTVEANEFQDARSEFERRGITVLGVSDDPVEDLAAFAEEQGLGFRLLSDEDGEVADEYDSYGEKRVYNNTVLGAFRNTYVVGPDGNIEFVYEDVTPDGHADEILADLDE
jgi:peroxiredoxin Q/BCP